MPPSLPAAGERVSAHRRRERPSRGRCRVLARRVRQGARQRGAAPAVNGAAPAVNGAAPARRTRLPCTLPRPGCHPVSDSGCHLSCAGDAARSPQRLGSAHGWCSITRLGPAPFELLNRPTLGRVSSARTAPWRQPHLQLTGDVSYRECTPAPVAALRRKPLVHAQSSSPRQAPGSSPARGTFGGFSPCDFSG